MFTSSEKRKADNIFAESHGDSVSRERTEGMAIDDCTHIQRIKFVCQKNLRIKGLKSENENT
jgi:hypothetical protein